jgi:TRAP-type mannitol/chloroaromatic compound transport system permease small subunit
METNGGIVNALLGLSRVVDRMNDAIGKATTWLILIVVVISAGNAIVRYTIDWSSNGLLEIQWYLFSAIFLLCAAYVLNKNEHIRIDVIAGRLSPRAQNWIDVFGIVVFLLPMVIMTMTLSWPVFMNAWNSGETSANPGGLIRWPVRLLMPVGFFLLLLQGLSELVKRLAFLTGNGPNPLDKVKAKTAEEELAEEIRKHRVSGEVLDSVEAAKDMLRNGGKEGGRK